MGVSITFFYPFELNDEIYVKCNKGNDRSIIALKLEIAVEWATSV